MSLDLLLSQLEDLDIRLWREGDRLRFNAPRGAMTEEIKAALRARKAELLAHLAARNGGGSATAAPLAPSAAFSPAADFGGTAEGRPRAEPGQEPGALPLSSGARGPMPLFDSQRRLWFMHRLAPESPAYNIAEAVRVPGPLSLETMRDSLDLVLQRQEILRCRFELIDDEPYQRIAPPQPVRLPVAGLEALSAADREAEAERLTAAEARRPFQLQGGPVLRIRMLRLGAEDHTILLSVHHIIADAWSMGLLSTEVVAAYTALQRGEEPRLPELPVQYLDFVQWRRRQSEGGLLEEQVAYWRRQLEGAPELLELPTDSPRAAGLADRGTELTALLPRPLLDRARATARELGHTLFVVLMSAFELLLHRLSGQADLVIGVPTVGRERYEVENLIGLFINTLAVRVRFGDQPAFSALAERVSAAMVGAYAHQNLPFARLVEELQPERSLSYSPIFQVIFQLHPRQAAAQVADLPAAAFARPSWVERPAKLDLEIALVEHPAGLVVRWLYRDDLFDRTTMQRWVEGWRNLLAAAVERPAASVEELPVLSAGQRQQTMVEWNLSPALRTELGPGLVEALRADQSSGSQDSVLEEFARQAEVTPERVAVRAGTTELRYRDLRDQVQALAGHLRRARRRLSVGSTIARAPELAVGLSVERSARMPVGLLAIWAAGGYYVPVDPSYPADRVAHMLTDSGCRILITESRVLGGLPPFDGEVILLDRPETWEVDGEEGEESPAHCLAIPSPDHRAYVIYTSGSTGKPKGVAISHRMLAGFLRSMRAVPGFTARDRFLALTSLSFDPAGLELYLPLCLGGEVVIADRHQASDGALLVRLLSEAQPTVLQATPSAWRLLLTAGWPGTPGLKALSGGEALPWSLAREILDRADELWNLYGPTEATVWASAQRVEPEQRHSRAAIVTLGWPVVGTDFHILDPAGRGVPLGASGELHIGGAWLARGYHGRPGLSAARFIPDPLSMRAGERLYRTGDRVRRGASGELEYLGRIDFQVKLRGFRIELGEIEAVLASHPRVKQAVAVVREDNLGDARLVAYLVAGGAEPEAGQPADAELREHARQALPEHMLPGAWVWLDELPRTPNAKIDRNALPAPRLESSTARVAPRSRNEEEIAAIWCEVLGLGSLGVHDDFFALGGHSLLAAQIFSRLTRKLDVELPIAAIFRAPTVAALAEEVARAQQSASGPPILPVPRGGHFPLTAQQQRVWFLDQLDPGTNAFNLHLVLPAGEGIEMPRFRRAITDLVARHDALRARFVAIGGRPMQTIVAPAPLVVPEIDLSALPEEVREGEARRLAAAHGELHFHLAVGPLLAVAVLRLSAAEHTLLLTIHHIIGDGWSMGLIIRDVAALYEVAGTGREPDLPALPVQYPDFAVWHDQRVASGELEPALEYWRRQLAGLPPLLDLPTDRPRPAVQSFRGADLPLHLGRELTAGVEALSQRSGVSPFMTLLTGWMTLLHRATAADDLCVGTYSAGRTHTEIEAVVGFFVNTLSLRADLGGDPSFGGMLARVREVSLGAYAHQEVPFETIVDELQPERSLAHWPFFQVMLILQNIPILDEDLAVFTVPPESAHGFGRANYDLTLWMWEAREELHGMLSYASDLFDRTTAHRLSQSLLRLLRAAVDEPDLPLSRLPVLSPAESHAVLFAWNDQQGALPSGSLEDLFVRQVERAPEALALVSGDEHLTYRELERRAGRLAERMLQQLGSPPRAGSEPAVGLLGPRSPAMVVGLLAALRAGAFYVPLDPAYPEERLAFLAEDSGVELLVVDERAATSLPASPASRLVVEAGGLEVAPAGEGAGGLDTPGLPGAPPLPGVPPLLDVPGAAAYAIYTSGSTGRPKGVLVPRSALLNHTLSAIETYRIVPGDRMLQFASFSFDASAEEVYPTLLAGATLVLRDEAMVDSAPAFALAVTRLAITVLDLPTAYWHELMAGLAAVGPVPAGLLRAVILGGEEAAPEHLATWYRTLGAPAPARAEDQQHRVRLFNSYGPTEATIVTTRHELTAPAVEGGAGGRRVPIGRPLTNAYARVLDAGLRPVPVGVVGELCLGGMGLARGYLGRPALTADRFVPDAFAGQRVAGRGARLYRSGDLARYRASGELEFLGRRDQQVKVRGFRIEPGEIEAALRARPEIAEALVTVREDVAGDPRLVAYMVPVGEGKLTITELRDALGTRLPAHMIPAAFLFLAELPRTPAGKVDRRALPVPDDQRPELAVAYVEPSGVIEENLAEIWAEVLGLGRVGTMDNFFELGGHSLLAVQVVARVRELFELDLEVLALFELPTVRQLAETVEGSLLDRLEEMSDEEVEALL